MKSIILLLLCTVSLLNAQENSNYTITINGETFDYTLDKEFEYKAKKNETIKISVSQKEILTYNDGIITFQYSKNFPISVTPEIDGVKQLTAIGSDGSGLIIQEYKDFDPSLMIDLMLNELTKESVDYGYTETISEIEIKIKGGKILKGKKSILEYQGIIDEWTVVSFSRKDSGVIIAAMNIDKETVDATGNKNVEAFFNSLEIIK